MKKIVVIDPGHGGHDPGAVGKSGLKESNMALDVCLRIKSLLDPYVKCILTRDSDVYLTLAQRPAIANRENADAFVSYHFNSGDSPNTSNSWEIFTTPGQNRSDELASAIGEVHQHLFSDQQVRADISDGDIDKEANFAVIRGTRCPSCLMEGEFIHTEHGEELIKFPANRQRMAVAVAIGTLNFLKVPHQIGGSSSVKATPPPTLIQHHELSLLERVVRIEKHLGL